MRRFLCRFPISYVVVGVSVGRGSEGCGGEFASVVVGEGVLPGGSLPCTGAGGGAAEGIVGVASQDDSGGPSRGVDGCGEVALRFVAAGGEEAVGVREGVEEVAAGEVGVCECFFFRSLEEGGLVQAAVRAVAPGDGVEGAAGFGEGVAGGAAVGVVCFGDGVFDAGDGDAVGVFFVVVVVDDVARALGVRDAVEVADVVVCVLLRRGGVAVFDAGAEAFGGVPRVR